jgi:putative FmdB family regulatory protein
MPTYAYRCPAGHEFERFERKISDKFRVKCPVCGKMAQRVITGGTGFLLKGSGFYATDYKKSAAEGEKRGEEKSEKGEKGEKGEKREKGEKQAQTEKPDTGPKKPPGADS